MIYRLVKGPQNTLRFAQNVRNGQIPSLFYRLVYGPPKTQQKIERDSNCSNLSRSSGVGDVPTSLQ